MQQFEANDTTVHVFHQNDLVGCFLADRLLGGIVEPDGERMPSGVMDYFNLVHRDRMLFRDDELPVGLGTTSGETEEGFDLEEEAIVNCASVLARDPGMGCATGKA
jgi:hypothetical protein